MNSGIINLNNGYTFLWMQGNGDGEISGHVEKPQGGLVSGLSGWYRTNDPDSAAKLAQIKLDGYK